MHAPFTHCTTQNKMASLSSFLKIQLLVIIFFTLLALFSAQHLSAGFYSKTCPQVLKIVNSTVQKVVKKEARMGASLLRLHFHDCFVNGCDGSILLDETPAMRSEKAAPPNNNSVRGFNIIEEIKAELEEKCPAVVSCADILAVAARDAVVALGGPSWKLKLGRRDSRTANFTGATNIPRASLNVSRLTEAFRAKGFSQQEMVALSGAHSIGKARCVLFRDRLYNETADMDAGLAATLRARCPVTGGDNNLTFLDVATPIKFDNAYYRNLARRRGLLHSDQALLKGGHTYAHVMRYGANEGTFRVEFAAAMKRMSNLSPLTGSRGEVRRRCSLVNV